MRMIVESTRMASAITHAVVGVALAQAGRRDWREQWTYWFLAVFCSVLPDIDVIGFRFGIHYGDFWGHRGMTHSLLVATGRDRWKAAFLFFVVTDSHGLLDAMTDGGLGVAFFSPFNCTRYFFGWRPIHVSPIAAHRFFSGRGLTILWSEVKCVWGPALLTGALLYSWRKRQESDIHPALSPPR